MTIALFLTEKTSFSVWERAGFLARGVKHYNRLAAQCDAFYFVTYGGKSEFIYQSLWSDNCRILHKPEWMPMRLYGFLSPFIHRRALKKADVFYSGQMQGAWSAVIAKILFGKKFVLNCGYQWSIFARAGGEGYIKRGCIYMIEWIHYRMADHIVVSSASARDYVMGRYGILLEHIDVIPNYVDTDLFRLLDIHKNPRSLIFVGRLEPQKNLDMLLDVIAGTDARLTIVGAGALEGHLKARAEKESIPVTFKGIILNENLPHELNKHTVFVLPSLYEGSPKALFEAMACGMPVVAADSPGIREVIQNGVTGFLCAPTVDGLRKAIIDIFNASDVFLEVGKRARHYIINTCDLNRKIAREVEIFNAVCTIP